MLVVLFNFLYQFLCAFLIGLAFRKLWAKTMPLPAATVSSSVVTGIVLMTVYVEYVSLFAPIALMAQIGLWVLCGLSLWILRKDLGDYLRKLRIFMKTPSFLVLVGVILVVAFYSSRGQFHTDTNLYHAQMIRLYEEFGILKGMGNLQLHFAYNSSYLAYCSLFTFSWLLPDAVHATTGFFTLFTVFFALYGLKGFSRRKRHGADAGRIAILLYAFINLTGAMSPATDYGTMYMTLYLLVSYLQLAEKTCTPSLADSFTNEYGLLSVLALFIVSMKFSAAVLVLIVIYPLVLLLKNKQWKRLLQFLGAGILSFLPFLIRNVIISGWLFYPFESIDLFSVSWKIPKEYSLIDSAQIKVWGRCLYDVDLVDVPISGWFSTWWGAQEHYHQMLLLGVVAGTILLVLCILCRILKKLPLRPQMALLWAVLYLSFAMWLFTAPFVRYGLSFLLLIPLLAIALAEETRYTGVFGIAAALLSMGILLSYASLLDHYAMDDLMFIKNEIKSPCYITQKPFDEAETGEVSLNGNTVYYSVEGIVNSYKNCPSTDYLFMLERTRLLGDTLESGFAPIAQDSQ